MVTYQAFVSLVYSETPDGAIEDSNENADFMASIGGYWSKNKDELKPMTKQQARKRIQRDLQP